MAWRTARGLKKVHLGRGLTFGVGNCRDLFGQCEFTSHIPGSLTLANELLAATKSSTFAAGAATLSADFNNTILGYETEYWVQTEAGATRQIGPNFLCQLHGAA